MTSIQPIEPSTTLIPERNTTKTLVVGIITAVFVIAAPFIIGTAGGNYWWRVLDFAMLYVMLALGLNVVVGFAGLLDLGYIAFYAVGAYTAALLSSPHLTSQFEWIGPLAPAGLHVPFWIIVPCAMGIAAFFGIILGAPTLRLRGDYLAIVTLGFGEIVPRVFRNASKITGGVNGIVGVDQPKVPSILGFHGFNFGFNPVPYYYLMLGIIVLTIFLISNLRNSRLGRAWMAIREDEVAA